MTVKLLYDPRKGRVLASGVQHACMVRPRDFDRMVRAVYFEDRNVIYFRFWAPNGIYELTSWGAAQARIVCERALAAFVRKHVVPPGVLALYWETGHGVTDADIRY